MELKVGEAELGTAETDWLASPRLRSARPLSFGTPSRLVVIAPHPDDEVLAAGGTMALLARLGVKVLLIAVTAGEASHPRSRRTTAAKMASRRRQERAVALARLGLEAEIVDLGIPDGGVARARGLADRLGGMLAPGDLCLAPWRRDGHPDHDAVGKAAGSACLAARVRLLSYPVWAWHWARPDGSALPWRRLARVPLPPSVCAVKRAAVAAFRSQIAAIGPDPEDRAILPPAVLARFLRPFEVFFQ